MWTCKSVNRGLGKRNITPLGIVTGLVKVDDDEVQQSFDVLSDDKIEYDALLGFDFASKFCDTLNANGFTLSQLSEQQECAEINQIIQAINTVINKGVSTNPGRS
ncbi:uncharacterized protein LOC119665731 [Teleopsis dalmanni]|uniref:uncharacterized protein LOC119665731 n=1 Tax=Teleopsis dalmanni TaxID=139649 RepID=UPI0018CF86C5|nr:uncharacterized protein LOC119665731 [Teleopsis dalmanni]